MMCVCVCVCTEARKVTSRVACVNTVVNAVVRQSPKRNEKRVVVGNGCLRKGPMNCRQLWDMTLSVNYGVLTSNCGDDEALYLPPVYAGPCRVSRNSGSVPNWRLCGLYSRQRTVRSDQTRWEISLHILEMFDFTLHCKGQRSLK